MVGAPKFAVTRTSFSNTGKPISAYARLQLYAYFVCANYHENFAERMIFFQLPQSLPQLVLYCLAAALRATSFQPGASLNAAFTRTIAAFGGLLRRPEFSQSSIDAMH
jgi:hypothetical protein